MRYLMVLTAAAALSACDKSDNNTDRPTVEPTAAAVTFDGSGANDRTAMLAHGERMSWMFGCRGCHGENLQGHNVSEKDPEFGDMNAPNLTLLMAQYTDADLEKVIRKGVPKDGREFWFMSSESFQYMSDADLSALVAHLRTIEPAGQQLPPIRKGPAFHQQVKEKLFGNSEEMIRRFRASQPADLGEQHRLGRYIAMTVCTECHNSELQGYKDFTPSLDIAGAYSVDEMKHLLRTGEGKAKKDLGLMSQTSRNRFSRLTDREMDAIVGYVLARANREQPPQ